MDKMFNKEEREFDVLSFGEILLRLSAPINERMRSSAVFEKNAGGSELNVVSGISLLGLRTGIISKIPKQDIGDYIRNSIRFSGVSDDWLIFDENPDSRLGIYFYEYGVYPRKPTVIYDRRNAAINSIKPEDLPESIYGSTRLFHTSGISLALSKETRHAARTFIRKFKEAGALISFDVNYRASLWNNEQAREYVESILPYVDILFLSEETARRTWNKTGDLESIIREFSKEFEIPIIASTERVVKSPKIHTFGSTIYNAKEDKFYKEAPYEDIEVVDRIGSGDAYVSGVLFGLLEYNDCYKALQYGNAYSSVKNTILGDLPSSDKKEIDRIISDHNNEGYKSELNR
jgi:2-dehydro-3-deoxygluconokinase